MGAYGLAWVRSDAFIRREVKTREKEEQMDAQDAFFNVRQRPKTSTKSASVVADDQRGSCGGIGQSRGKQTGIYSRRNAQAKKTNNAAEKKGKRAMILGANQSQNKQKKSTVRNEQRNQQKKLKRRKRETEREIKIKNSL